MGGATRSVFHLLLWHVQKQIVLNVLRSYPVLYIMNLTGFSKSDFLTTQPATLNFWLEFCFIDSERLDWVKECARSLFVFGVNSITFCRFLLYIYLFIYIYEYVYNDTLQNFCYIQTYIQIQ
jgi:hypothetical protein